MTRLQLRGAIPRRESAGKTVRLRRSKAVYSLQNFGRLVTLSALFIWLYLNLYMYVHMLRNGDEPEAEISGEHIASKYSVNYVGAARAVRKFLSRGKRKTSLIGLSLSL